MMLGGHATAHVDHPLQADGNRVAIRLAQAWLLIVTTGDGATAAVFGTNPAAVSAAHVAFALENALLKVRPHRFTIACR